MSPCKELCSLTHSVRVQRFRHMIDVISLKNIDCLCVSDFINIRLASGVEASVKFRRFFFCFNDPHRRYGEAALLTAAQGIVYYPRQFFDRDIHISFKGSLLSQSVYSGVCPAGSVEQDLSLEQPGKDNFQVPLHRGFVRLPLPSVKACAIIGNFQ